MTDDVLAELREGVLHLTINRPDRKNALNKAVYLALSKHLAEAESSAEVRVLLLSGAGGCFTSGNDLHDFVGDPDLTSLDNPVIRFMKGLATFPKPIVVAVEGVAVGIGTTLLLHSDMVYASPETNFSLPFVNLGLCPEYASSFLLPRLSGHVKACEWLFLGEFFSAQDAKEGGIINQVVDDPLAVAREQCLKLASKPPAALRSSKALIKAPMLAQIDEVIKAEVKVFGEALNGKEFSEAVTAFFEKRQADFSACK